LYIRHSEPSSFNSFTAGVSRGFSTMDELQVTQYSLHCVTTEHAHLQNYTGTLEPQTKRFASVQNNADSSGQVSFPSKTTRTFHQIPPEKNEILGRPVRSLRVRTERLLELVKCISEQLASVRVLGVLTNAVQHHRNLGAALHRRDEEIGQLQTPTPRVLLTPLPTNIRRHIATPPRGYIRVTCRSERSELKR